MGYSFNPFTGTFDNVGSATPAVTVVPLIAATSIIAYKVITTNASGQAIYADSATLAHANTVIGIAGNAASAGGSVGVQNSGIITNSGWSWTAGETLFLGSNGDLTRNALTGLFTLRVGYAKSPTEVYIRIERGIIRV